MCIRDRGLRVSIQDANRIKQKHGCVAGFLLNEEERQELIEITPVGRSETRGLSKEILCDIMQPRALELLQHVAQEVNGTQLQIPSGVVLTGGGSMVRGMNEIAEQVFDAPTRNGLPEPDYFGGLAGQIQTSSWAVACGLALSSMREQIRGQNIGGRSATRRMAEWFGNIRGKFK